MAGTNLLKVICNHCGWKGLSHQWAFVRHFISKLKWNAMLEIFAAKFQAAAFSHSHLIFMNKHSKNIFFSLLHLAFEEGMAFPKWRSVCLNRSYLISVSFSVCLNGVMCSLYPFHTLSAAVWNCFLPRQPVSCCRLQIMWYWIGKLLWDQTANSHQSPQVQLLNSVSWKCCTVGTLQF